MTNHKRKNKSMNQNFIVPDHIIKTMQRAARVTQPLIDAQRKLSDIAESIQPFVDLAQQIQKNLAPILNEQRKLVEFVERAKKYKKSEKTAMLKSGWWITPSLMDVPAIWISQAVSSYQGGNEPAITNLFKKVYQKDNCKYLEGAVIGWRENKYFTSWEKHLDKALEAHKNKKYILSVPTLLLVSEGIATDFCKREGIYKKKLRSSGGEKIKMATRQSFEKTSHFLLSSLDLLESAIDSTIYQDTDLIKTKLKKNVLNRHAVLHGIKKDYGTMKASLQAFMLLDVLSGLE